MRAKRFDIITPLSGTLESATAAKTQCAVEVSRLRLLAGKYRRQLLYQPAQVVEDQENKKKTTEIRVIMKIEQVRNKWRQINCAQNRNNGKSINTVTVKTVGKTIKLDTQLPLEDAIIANNSSSFTIVYNTPLLNDSQIHDLRCLVDTNVAKKIY